ncbi:MAG: signal peptidase II [Caldilineaceae bacterium]|nr:signal peptidase II [Caldilineaceae bacterium]
MNKLKRVTLLLAVLFSTIGCDQATKSMAQTHLAPSEPLSFLNGIVRLQYAENSGAFLSLGAGLPGTAQHWVFTVTVAVVLSGILLFALRESLNAPATVLVALALFLGGGLGNLIDRLTNDGRVIDFMHIGIGNLRTGIFNVADMALMTGVALLLLYSFRTRASNATDETNGA